jgi:hypothetical protein
MKYKIFVSGVQRELKEERFFIPAQTRQEDKVKQCLA